MAEREQALLAIRIPLFKGLIGTRLLLINATDQPRFDQITGGAQLRVLHAGQGHDWPDTDILLHNGYAVAGIDQQCPFPETVWMMEGNLAIVVFDGGD